MHNQYDLPDYTVYVCMSVVLKQCILTAVCFDPVRAGYCTPIEPFSAARKHQTKTM